MMDPPALSGAVNVAPGSGAVPNTADEEKNSKIDSASVSQSIIDNPKIRDLQNLNKKLEEELQEMRESFNQKDNSEHFKKIQELFNKIQIENKNLRIYNQKCESKLESK
jgi:glutamine synthetase type III